MSKDDLIPDDMGLDEYERLAQNFKLNEDQKKLLAAVQHNMPVTGIGKMITEDYWLALVLRGCESTDKNERIAYSRMLGQYLGTLKEKRGGDRKPKVEFVEE